MLHLLLESCLPKHDGVSPSQASLEVLDLKHVEPVHDHHCFNEISFEIDVSGKTRSAFTTTGLSFDAGVDSNLHSIKLVTLY